MFGNNPKRPPLQGDGSRLDIQEIFTTLQGEGPYAGWPALFIRLGGCNLACRFCDTEFETFTTWDLSAILTEADKLTKDLSIPLVVITGGEPFRQPIAPLCAALEERGYKVQIECNGTLYRPLPDAVEVICSPKHQGNGYLPLRQDLLSRVTALKFLISASDPRYNHVAELGQTAYKIPVYVQPMDEYDEQKNAENRILAISLATQHGYRLSLQLHKLLGIA